MSDPTTGHDLPEGHEPTTRLEPEPAAEPPTTTSPPAPTAPDEAREGGRHPLQVGYLVAGLSLPAMTSNKK